MREMLSTQLKKRKAGAPAGTIDSFYPVKRGPGRPPNTEDQLKISPYLDVVVSRYQRERLNACADEQMVARMIMKEATGEDALLKKPERRKQFRQAYGAAGDPRYLSGRPVLRRMETLEDLAEALAE